MHLNYGEVLIPENQGPLVNALEMWPNRISNPKKEMKPREEALWYQRRAAYMCLNRWLQVHATTPGLDLCFLESLTSFLSAQDIPPLRDHNWTGWWKLMDSLPREGPHLDYYNLQVSRFCLRPQRWGRRRRRGYGNDWEGGRENESPYLGRNRRKPYFSFTLQYFILWVGTLRQSCTFKGIIESVN